ncbi:hypothetical protein [Natrinema sp. 1APR25-10V2]|uniref:DUF7563 family protein n=1 Tax=Natrinema sp. 1APR25-10V2 TaxID=2951081 RepID=UPI002876A62D|nr:hypothetical protein [Natrinema sp. 1APR25-10V2]MDS0473794.1 hypothetical protein [Natrinema sp. 1APR25-10V2]
MVSVTVTPWPSVDNSTCRHCDDYVTDRFRRIFRDDDDRAHRCGGCDTYARLSRGSAVGVDVAIPDPETSLGRHGGEADA